MLIRGRLPRSLCGRGAVPAGNSAAAMEQREAEAELREQAADSDLPEALAACLLASQRGVVAAEAAARERAEVDKAWAAGARQRADRRGSVATAAPVQAPEGLGVKDWRALVGPAVEAMFHLVSDVRKEGCWKWRWVEGAGGMKRREWIESARVHELARRREEH